MKRFLSLALAMLLILSLLSSAIAAEPDTVVPEELQKSQLLVVLPEEYVSTPDGMVIAPEGDLIVACPNFGDLSMPGVIIRIKTDGTVSKWFDVPVNAASGQARPMGIDLDADGNLYIVDNQGWTGAPETQNQGRILKVTFKDGEIDTWTEIATGMEHPNGLKVHNGKLYVTQSCFGQVSDPSGKLVSGVYAFPMDAEGIKVTNTLEDEHLITSFITQNPNCQYGADGLVFDKEGNLYVGNFGDSCLNKITFDANGAVTSNEIWVQSAENMTTTDGMCIAEDGTIYVADFSRNALAKVTTDGTVTRIAQSPDSDGLLGQMDQPGEPIIWDNKIVMSCFDMVTDDGKINSAHNMPATMCWVPVE